jgi:hypothetical protein
MLGDAGGGLDPHRLGRHRSLQFPGVRPLRHAMEHIAWHRHRKLGFD